MIIKKALAIATSVALLATMSVATVFAEPIKELGPNDNSKVDARVTKALTAGKSTDIDSLIKSLEYTFDFEQISVKVKDGSPSSTVEYDSISTTEQAIPITSQKITVEDKTENYATDNSATDYYRKESGNFLAGFASKVRYQGIYVYKITEKNDVDAKLTAAGWTKAGNEYTRTDHQVGDKKFDETFTMSQAEYQLRIYTKLRPGSTGGIAGAYYVSAITLVQTKTDAGETIDNGPKKDPTYGGDQTTYKTSQLEFQNKYIKTEKKDPDDPTGQPYEISKRVTGVDQDDKILHGGTKFRFTVKMTLPDAAEKKVYEARIFESDNGSSYKPKTGGTVTFDFAGLTGDSVTKVIELEHHDKVTFPGVPVGTTFTTIEDDYFTTGIEGSNKDPNDSTKNLTYKLKAVINGGAVPSDADAPLEATRTDVQTVASNASKASAYVNDGNTGTTPAGVIMQYLPFMIIILLAIAALIAMAIIKSKRRSMAS